MKNLTKKTRMPLQEQVSGSSRVITKGPKRSPNESILALHFSAKDNKCYKKNNAIANRQYREIFLRQSCYPQ